MSQDISESMTSLKYIMHAYNSLHDVLEKEMQGVVSNSQIKPISFDINFLSFKEGETKIELFLLNGTLNSKMQQLKFNGFIILNYSFKIQTTELAAKGLLRIKIIDVDFLKEKERQTLL
ncbi:MAG: hypothetical protein JNM51_02660 [Bacteroidia bacterium]|nr:hypothetical protein [Bacteroidia bacterium]